MRVERLTIRNFRSLENVSVELAPRITVLVGANNAGKSTVIEALAAILTFRGGLAFAEQDFRSVDASQSARSSTPIEIEVSIAPTSGPRFLPGELGQHNAQVLANGDERFLLRLQTRWNHDPSIAGLESRLIELRADGTELGTIGRFPFGDLLPLHPFGAERDLKRGLSGRWSDWGRVVADSRPPAEVRARAMERFRGASDYLVKNTPGLDTIRDALGQAGSITGIGALDVSLTAAPDDVDELLRRVSIELRHPGAQRAFAGDRHGHGTQGALLFAVYRLHAQRLSAGRSSVCPVMTVEEPEVHLHPTAQRALGGVLATLPGQVVMTTHSPEMVTSKVRPILLRTTKGTATAHQGNWSKHVSSYPRALFSRCVLLVEGLEASALDLCARAIGFNLHERGVETINVQGQGNLLPLWETFGPLGFRLPVACLADGDATVHLDAFLNKLVAVKLIAAAPTENTRHGTLAKNAYFVTKKNRNIEEALVEDCEEVVDAVLLSSTGQSFSEWRAARERNELSQKRCNRANSLRAAKATKLVHKQSVVGDLSEQEARIERLSNHKAIVPVVFERLTLGGTDPSRLPAGFRRALEWVDRATR